MLIHGNSKYIGLADESIHCAITSIPYWGLRDYGLEPQIWGGRVDCKHEWGDSISVTRGSGGNGESSAKQTTSRGSYHDGNAGQFCRHCGAWRGSLGLEPTPDLFVANVVAIFREVWRVLRPDGTLWLNIGDTFATGSNGRSAADTKAAGNDDRTFRDKPFNTAVGGLKPKDLCGIPWRVAFALQADGWWLRSDIIWAKPNPMPESVTDRPTKSHEYLFLLTKSERYFYDAEAVREPHGSSWIGRTIQSSKDNPDRNDGGKACETGNPAGRNRRTVWTIATESYDGAHYATFPTKLVEPCILAGTSQYGCCQKCGAPWERVIESTKISTEQLSNGNKAQSPAVFARGGNQAKFGRAGDYHTTTTGWRPACSCGTHLCQECEGMVQYPADNNQSKGNIDNASQNERSQERLQKRMVEEKVCKRSEIQGEAKGQEQEVPAQVRSMRQGLYGADSRQQVLQQGLLDSVDARERTGKQVQTGTQARGGLSERAETGKLYRQEDDERVLADISAGSSECQQERIHTRTSTGNVESSESSTIIGGSSTPYQRNQDRQQNREFDSDEQEFPQSLSTTGVPPLREAILCERCGKPITPLTPVPAIVLDPFAGSGTVGQVARQLGRRFVGIDLNPSYLAINALPRAERLTSQKAIDDLPLFSFSESAQ